ncbi:Carbonic anhydrase 3, partial [Ophiophagus hannah]
MRKQSTADSLTWGYSKENAKGNNQSPVAILSKDVFKDPALLPWFTGYDPGAAKNIRNTGKILRIAFDDTFDRSGNLSLIRGGVDSEWANSILVTANKGKEAPFPNFDPSILFPQNRSYYTYQGSFTMPPCEECVTWIVMKEPMTVDEQQMLKLRSLSSNSAEDPHCPLQDNWRPLQPLNNRMIRSTCQ